MELEIPKKERKIFGKIIDILCNILLVVCILVVILRIFVFDIGHVPSGSMEPTLHVGCNLLIDKWRPDYERGDIVVFKSQEYDKILVKRLIGKPGDHVVLEGNRTYVNDELIVEDYVKNPSNVEEEYEFDVPDDCYFFLGDNRFSSNDARYWEQPYIEKDDLIGEVCLVVDIKGNPKIYIPK